ncbi:Stp1/IreP family PP2C-type Ser/Thr phosphatase [Ornithinibacillus halotolerans]|uniref:protein-serine/threonine phosphatase n=1 Tax=Ornithinibacillus halotolerans TaxID=1274357 RepID=A0A916S5Q5_9BACI|nr:Stp1/IreP family PP2C-type Ser/Thr phosphatase [Ornithinibacillus halotolerans]GGA84196.1 protein phosphatase [Ornithinibacillus halotolerans]
MEGHFLTDRGQVRSHNEDSGGIFLNNDGQYLAIIADGMGGHQAGDVASRLATTILEDKWKKNDGIHTPDVAEEWLKQALLEANTSIYQHSLEKEDCQGMGTTIVVAVCTKEFITVAHIGDSRCYLYNEYSFKQITEDHSLVNALVQSGQISKDDALVHPRKNVVLKALGTSDTVEPDIQTINWEKGDKLLLCSDGLTDKVRDSELEEYLQSKNEIDKVGEKLVDLANERGGEDNVSLVILQHEATVEEGDPFC